MKFGYLHVPVLISLLAYTCFAAPLELEGAAGPTTLGKQSLQAPKTYLQHPTPTVGDGSIPPGSASCPQTIVVNNKRVEVASLLTECHAHQELLELFYSTKEEFSAAIGNTKTALVICTGFVSLVEDVSRRQELTSLCKDKILEDVSLVGSSYRHELYMLHNCMCSLYWHVNVLSYM